MAEDIIRVLRILEYTGPRSWVESSIGEQRAVKGERHFPAVGAVIREAIVGQWPEILQSKESGS